MTLVGQCRKEITGGPTGPRMAWFVFCSPRPADVREGTSCRLDAHFPKCRTRRRGAVPPPRPGPPPPSAALPRDAGSPWSPPHRLGEPFGSHTGSAWRAIAQRSSSAAVVRRHAYHWGLEKAKAHLAALGAQEVVLPRFDESKFGPLPKVAINPKARNKTEPVNLHHRARQAIGRLRCPGQSRRRRFRAEAVGDQ